jgi:uncharacterized HAD superfamily protein
MIIGIDIDDVIADFVPIISLYHNELYGGSLSKADFISYDFWKVWGGTKEEAVRKVDEMFANSMYFLKIPTVENSIPSLARLKEQGVVLHAITGRRNNAIQPTTEWIEKYFPNTFASTHFTNMHCLEGRSVKKSKICKELGVTILIEDFIDHALDCAENNIRVLLFDSPWNQNVPKHEKIEKVFSWDEILKKI